MAKQMDRFVTMTRRKGLLRPRDLAETSIPREYLRRACKQGLLERVGRGLYRVPGTMATESQSLAEVCRKVPMGVVFCSPCVRLPVMRIDLWAGIRVTS
jgi:predicted transcriptional regulator of viral defense system